MVPTQTKTPGVQIAIRQYDDIVVACQKGRAIASREGLSSDGQVSVVLAVLEIARQVVRGARHGRIVLSPVRERDKRGVVIGLDGQTQEMIVERLEQ